MYADVVTDKSLLAVRTSVGVCSRDVKETRIFFGIKRSAAYNSTVTSFVVGVAWVRLIIRR